MVPEFLATLIAQDKAEYRRETIGFSQFYSLIVPDGKVIFITNIEINPCIDLPTNPDFLTVQDFIDDLKIRYANSIFQLRVFNQFSNYRYTYKPALELTGFQKASVNPGYFMGTNLYFFPTQIDCLIKCTKDTYFSIAKILQPNGPVASQVPQNTLVNNTDNDQTTPAGSKNSTNEALYALRPDSNSSYMPMTNKYTDQSFLVGNNVGNFFIISTAQPVYPFTGAPTPMDYTFFALTHMLNIEFVILNLNPGA